MTTDCYNLGVTERHRVAYRLRTAAEGPDGIEQWWTVEKCKQRRVVAQGRILGVHQQCMEYIRNDVYTPCTGVLFAFYITLYIWLDFALSHFLDGRQVSTVFG